MTITIIPQKSSAQKFLDLLLHKQVDISRYQSPQFHCLSWSNSVSIKMATTARRRLMRDFKRLQEDPPEGVSGAPGENNIMVSE